MDPREIRKLKPELTRYLNRFAALGAVVDDAGELSLGPVGVVVDEAGVPSSVAATRVTRW